MTRADNGHGTDGGLLERAAIHCARHFPDGGPLAALTAPQILGLSLLV